jgi:ABC-2 type transport system ATP-binding protein
MAHKMLEVKDLCKSFGKNQILNNVNFEVGPGDVFGFLGPNGAGKTTTVRAVLGLIRPDRGTITINGYSIKDSFKQAISHVGAVVETPKFYNYLSGYQNILLIANLHRNIPKGKIDLTLEKVGLYERAQDLVGTYSLGMKQRLGIARTLINDPQLIFLDEPMNGLDPEGIIEVRGLIIRLSTDQGITFFMTSHMLHEVEQTCNRIAILDKGRILIQGMVDQLLDKDRETVEIYTRDISKTQQCLQSLGYIKSHRPLGKKVLVELDQGASGKLNRDLVSLGIDVEYLVPVNQSLESLYMKFTQGE